MSRELICVLMADTHELHRDIDVPAGDILIHAGDFTMSSGRLSAIEDFNEWLGELPYRHRIVVPGNHEFFLEADEQRRSLLSNATVLIKEGVVVEGLRFWGSPVTSLHGVAYGIASPEAAGTTLEPHAQGGCPDHPRPVTSHLTTLWTNPLL